MRASCGDVPLLRDARVEQLQLLAFGRCMHKWSLQVLNTRIRTIQRTRSGGNNGVVGLLSARGHRAQMAPPPPPPPPPLLSAQGYEYRGAPLAFSLIRIRRRLVPPPVSSMSVIRKKSLRADVFKSHARGTP